MIFLAPITRLFISFVNGFSKCVKGLVLYYIETWHFVIYRGIAFQQNALDILETGSFVIAICEEVDWNLHYSLTLLPLHKMVTISQTTFGNAFLWMKTVFYSNFTEDFHNDPNDNKTA